VGACRENQRAVYCFEVNDGELFAFAELWERWKDPSGDWIRPCAILTTTTNAVTGAVHDRMPEILVDLANSDDYDLWLDSGFTDVTVVAEMLKPYDARLMRCFPVSTRINNAANADPKCSANVASKPLRSANGSDGSTLITIRRSAVIGTRLMRR
jgi:putative SOS response-associated peptidase YedK